MLNSLFKNNLTSNASLLALDTRYCIATGLPISNSPPWNVDEMYNEFEFTITILKLYVWVVYFPSDT